MSSGPIHHAAVVPEWLTNDILRPRYRKRMWTSGDPTMNGNLHRLRRDDADPTSLPRAGFSPNHDLDILVERRQQIHQAFEREARQLVVTKRRDLRLGDSQHLGGIGLREPSRFKHLIQGIGQPSRCST